MHDEFRVRVHVGAGAVRGLVAELQAIADGATEPAPAQPDPIAVSYDSDDVFLYTSSQAGAERALVTARDALARSGAPGTATCERWHPLEESWEDASNPLPASPAEEQAERERLRDDERAESAKAGWPQWEVRIAAGSFHEARELGDRLRGEGLPVLRRWRYVFVGAPSEDDAAELRQRLRDEAPPDSQLQIEANESTRRHSAAGLYAFFGGLGQ